MVKVVRVNLRLRGGVARRNMLPRRQPSYLPYPSPGSTTHHAPARQRMIRPVRVAHIRPVRACALNTYDAGRANDLALRALRAPRRESRELDRVLLMPAGGQVAQRSDVCSCLLVDGGRGARRERGEGDEGEVAEAHREHACELFAAARRQTCGIMGEVSGVGVLELRLLRERRRVLELLVAQEVVLWLQLWYKSKRLER